MASPVQAKACVIYAKIGSVYYPVACAKDVNITTTSEFIEIAARTSNSWREYEYGRQTGKITGTGITKVNTGGNLYSIFDVLGQQLQRLKFLVKFSVNDLQGNYKVFECTVLVEEVNIAGSAAALSNYSYTLQISGPVTMSSTPVSNTNPQILIYEFVATGGEAVVVLPLSSSGTIIVVYLNGESLRVVNFPGGYDSDEVQYNPATGELAFGTVLTPGDEIKVVYVDVDAASIVPAFAREVGDGSYRTVGDGSYRTSA